jgi:predicted ATPase/class 3 adenylate cyclase/predicted negative regulator of RcsB-dependent stress response
MMTPVRGDLPTGTVTFLFTDVEGSTKLLHELGADAYAEALAEHRRVIREACAVHDGVEVDTQGDAFFFAFPTAPGALTAAEELTRELASSPIRVRIGLHTGTPLLTNEGYVGGDVHRAARIAAAGHGGQVLVSSATEQLVEVELLDLGDHRFKDLGAPERVYQLGDAEFAPLKSLFRTNLPVSTTPFLGRERELVEVVDLLDGTRLLTLTGPGGTGKTRLAAQAAGLASDNYPDGVWWVPLAALREPELVLETAAQVFDSANGLVEHIADKSMLMLFDNFEQVVEAAGAVASLLVSCPNLDVLVTSREPLRLSGEQEYAVPPLVHEEGVAFFLARARAIDAGFQADDAVSEICRRLDDLPLALELAAARVKALSSAQILERLEKRLPLLTGGARDLPERQRTLRGAIEWSYELLNEEEQRLFARLSVFRGGCTLEAAEAVCEADVDTLHSLVDKSLLRHTNERYWMLETIGDYARERLDEAGETDALARRHADYHLALLEERGPYPLVLGSRRRELLVWFGEEEDNFRAALDYLEGAAPPDAARAADLLTPFWLPRGRLVEGQERLLRLLARNDFAAGTRAMLLVDLSDHELRLGQLDSAEFHAQEAVTLAQESGDGRTLAFALFDLGVVASCRGDFDEAIRVLTRVVEEAADDEWLRSIALSQMASFQMDAGRDEEARHMLQEASRGLHATEDETNRASANIYLAYLELYVRDFEAAYVVAASVLEKVRAIGDLHRGMGARNALGFAAVGLGRRSEAREAFAESLDLFLAADRTGDGALTETLAGIALAADPAYARSAAQLQGAVNKLDEASTRSPRFLELERYLGQPLIDALGADEYANEQAVGAGMDTDDAIDLARTLANTESQGAGAEY